MSFEEINSFEENNAEETFKAKRREIHKNRKRIKQEYKEQVEKDKKEVLKDITKEDRKTGAWFAKLLLKVLSVHAKKVNAEYFQEKYATIQKDVIAKKLTASYLNYNMAVGVVIGGAGGLGELPPVREHLRERDHRDSRRRAHVSPAVPRRGRPDRWLPRRVRRAGPGVRLHDALADLPRRMGGRGGGGIRGNDPQTDGQAYSAAGGRDVPSCAESGIRRGRARARSDQIPSGAGSGRLTVSGAAP